MAALFETNTARKRRDENENRSDTLVISDVAVLMNDQMVYIRQDMNGNADLEQLLDTMRQIRRTIQVGCKQRERMTIFASASEVTMFYAPKFERSIIRGVLVERLHAQADSE